MMYILDGHAPVPEPDANKWGRWFETADRKVALDHVGFVDVSTVFLGLNHGFHGGVPLLFETMIFGGPLADSCWRYATWDEAVAGHERALAMAMQAQEEKLS